MKIILQNRDFTEYVKGWDENNLFLSQDVNDAYNFSSVEAAEAIRLEVQETTGNRWRILIED